MESDGLLAVAGRERHDAKPASVSHARSSGIVGMRTE